MSGGALFWFIMGMLFILVAAGARAWAEALRLKMTWWKWVLALLWYVQLNITVAAPMTFIGEDEAAAGGKLFLFMLVTTIILGVILWRLLILGRAAKTAK